MFDDMKWAPVAGNELKGFLSQIGVVDGNYKTDEATTTVEYVPVSFYPQAALIRLKDTNWTPGHLELYYLTLKGELFRLNGFAHPIHDINAKCPIKVTEKNVLDYLRFFCFFVRGEEGPFYIVETADDPNLPSDLDDTSKTAIAGVVRPMSYEGKDNDGNYICDAIVYYGKDLFLAKFKIEPSGMIYMEDDEPLSDNLSSPIDLPVA